MTEYVAALAKLEWDKGLPPGYLVDHAEVWWQHDISIEEIGRRLPMLERAGLMPPRWVAS